MTATTLLTLIRPLGSATPGLCCIESDRKVATYEYAFFQVAREMGAVGIELRRTDQKEPYHLLISPRRNGDLRLPRILVGFALQAFRCGCGIGVPNE